MDTIPAEDDDVEPTESEDEEEEERPTQQRRKRAAGLTPLAGMSRTPKPSRAKGKQPSNVITDPGTIARESDEEATPKPVRRKTQPRRKTLEEIEIVDVSEGVETPKAPAPRKKTQKKHVEKIIPDSAGEERDVWVISSDEE